MNDLQRGDDGARATLAESDLRSILGSAPDGVLVVDRSGRITFANPMLESLFGYGRGELLGRPVEELLPEALREGHEALRDGAFDVEIARPMGSGPGFVGRRADGSEFPIDVSLSPTSAAGRPAVIAFVRDVTHRIRLDEALRLGEERLRLLVENVVDHALFVVDPAGRIESWNAGAERLMGYSAGELVGEHISVLYPEEDRRSGLPEEELERARAEGYFVATRRSQRADGTRFRARASLTRIADQAGVLRGYVEVIRDVTETYRLSAIAGLTSAILSGASVPDLLEMTSHYAASIVDAGLCWVVGREAGDNELKILAASGYRASEIFGITISDSSVFGSALEGSSSITLTDLAIEGGDLPESVLRDLGSALVVPLRHGDLTLGVLVVAHAAGDAPFRGEQVALVKQFANQAALVLHTRDLRNDVQRLGMLEDRERIARDLHDTVIQRLFATGMSLQSTGVFNLPPEAKARIEESIGELDETIRSIRTTIFDLQRPANPSLAANAREQILKVVAESSRALGFTPSVEFTGPVDTLVGIEPLVELVPVLREALSNVARHAKASHVDVRIDAGADITLSVTDDGVGFTPGAPSDGRGLENMSDRARRLRGRTEIRPRVGSGTRVIWSVPTNLGS